MGRSIVKKTKIKTKIKTKTNGLALGCVGGGSRDRNSSSSGSGSGGGGGAGADDGGGECEKKERGGMRDKDDGMMDHDTDGDGAINLSTSQRPSAATTPNGDIPGYGQDQQDNDQVREQPLALVKQ
ncbi:hypothetical protein M0802_010294 [Mischocyttarus mexicanus]|nr:hypothetical protein M0802_010294 [Mischocyttarus mexicanus]